MLEELFLHGVNLLYEMNLNSTMGAVTRYSLKNQGIHSSNCQESQLLAAHNCLPAQTALNQYHGLSSLKADTEMDFGMQDTYLEINTSEGKAADAELRRGKSQTAIQAGQPGIIL